MCALQPKLRLANIQTDQTTMKTKKLILLAVLFPGLLLAGTRRRREDGRNPASEKAPGPAHDAAAPLSEADQKRLTDLASANPIVAVVSLDAGRFTGAAMEHRVKIRKAIKGEIESNVLFAEIRIEERLAALQDPETPKVKLAPGDYLGGRHTARNHQFLSRQS